MPQKILKNIFGYNDFRPLQSDIIQNALENKDTIVLMPTTTTGSTGTAELRPENVF